MEHQKAVFLALLLLIFSWFQSHFATAARLHPQTRTAPWINGGGEAAQRWTAVESIAEPDDVQRHSQNAPTNPNASAPHTRQLSRIEEKRGATAARTHGVRGRKLPSRPHQMTTAAVGETRPTMDRDSLLAYSTARVHACGRDLVDETLRACHVYKLAIDQLNLNDLYLFLGFEPQAGALLKFSHSNIQIHKEK